MKVIIAGSRTIDDYERVLTAVNNSQFVITEVVSGLARGVDQLGVRYANAQQLPCAKFPADWELQPRAAGYLRNLLMANYADALIAVWDGHTRGTKHMIDTMVKLGKPTYVDQSND